jgi:hypothetical protein
MMPDAKIPLPQIARGRGGDWRIRRGPRVFSYLVVQGLRD